MLREILARFGIRVNTAPLTAANAQTGGFIRNLNIMGGLLAGGLIVRGLTNFVRNMIDMGDETAKTARQLGIGARELSAWQFAASRAGVDANQLTTGFRRLQRNIVDASEGLSTAVRAFDALGVSFEDQDGNVRELLDVVPELADAFVGLDTATERSARAQQLFGRAGAQLLPFFENGSEGIEEMLERFERLGIGLEDDFFAGAEQAQDALADFDLAMTGLKASITTEILPAISRFAVKVAELVADFNEATQETDLWKAGLIALGAVAAAVGIAMVAAFIAPIALILFIAAVLFAAILLVDDFITFLEGGESAIGTILEEFLGKDATDRIRQAINDIEVSWDRLADFMNEVVLPIFAAMPQAYFEIGQAAAAAAQIVGAAFEDQIGALQGFISGAVQAIVGLVAQVEAVVMGFVERASRAIQTVTGGLGAVAGFLGVEVSGTATGGRRAPTAPGVAPRGGGGANIAQETNVNVDARGAAPGEGANIARQVRRAVEDANTFVIRNAQRALTQVVE